VGKGFEVTLTGQGIQKVHSRAIEANPDPSKPLHPARWEAFLQSLLGQSEYDTATALKDAGFKLKNKKVAQQTASRLLANVAVRARRDWILAQRVPPLQEVLDRLGNIARQDPKDLFSPVLDKDGNVKGHKPEHRDMIRALELLAKHHGGISDNLFVRTLPSDPAALAEVAREEIRRIMGEQAQPRQLEEAPVEAEIVSKEGDKDGG
jgi:hypothetical protein